MTFCIITHVPHSQSEASYFGYAPYVNEMNIWLKYVDKVIIVAPLCTFEKSEIHQNYVHPNIVFIAVPSFSITSFFAVLKTIFQLPLLFFSIFKAMKSSTHIHLRCPGNMGLLGSLVQIFFPNKNKTAKYAGNWDTNSPQPFSYKVQRRILSNTFLTRNMTVLVYGHWKNQSKNIKSFFTATYFEHEKVPVVKKLLTETVQFLFVGSLTSGKNPLLAVKIMEALHARNHNVQLSVYGSGAEYEALLHYIQINKLTDFIFLKGISNREQLKEIYKESHFLLLPSKSEGWPKVVAEAMFWGCLPIATPISCIPSMLDNGNRGILMATDWEDTVSDIEKLLNNQVLYDFKIKQALLWSRTFTINTFEAEIKELLL